MGITLEDSSQSDKNTIKTLYIVISPHDTIKFPNLTNLPSTIQAQLYKKIFQNVRAKLIGDRSNDVIFTKIFRFVSETCQRK